MSTIHFEYQTRSKEQLDQADQQLITKAVEAMDGAHAPYSHFSVGSAVQMVDHSIVTGNNQENAAYPSGLCAERVALFAAKSQSKQAISTIAIVARNQKNKPADAFSCGNCRQVMMEYANLQEAPIRIIMGDHNGQFVIVEDVRLLLPFSFHSKSLD
ncbi:cytidine deaminase [Marinoscillum sp.]|uniref:cytidine deaminase n=1 Tax=Marinoscillum sp. TaxID=2024838 RepID=UPI003BAC900B